MLWILAAASVPAADLRAIDPDRIGPAAAHPNPLALQTDFHYYYDAARPLLGARTRLYLPSDDVIAGFAYPPPAIVPFMWLSGWPLGTALLAFTIASYLVLFVALQQWVGCLKRHGFVVDRRTTIALMLIAFALGPTYMNAIFGQVNAFVLACAVAFVCLAPTATLEAALVLAFGTWLKVYPIMLAAIGVVGSPDVAGVGVGDRGRDRDRHRRHADRAAAAFRSFFFDVLPSRIDKTAIHISNQSLVAFLERFRYPSHQFLNWTGEQAVTVTAAVRIVNLVAAGSGDLALGDARGEARARRPERRDVDRAHRGHRAARLGTHLHDGVTARDAPA